ncbi:M23 family metallopeptidase [Leucobacter salsicius]|uniref:M23 family metallopeptidase n=1 Tax=Leucobacter salsicius TaxID=664638 RepID=UPI00034A2BBB|nr:M23 family metallopeptidase [Leucobacter salsicius]
MKAALLVAYRLRGLLYFAAAAMLVTVALTARLPAGELLSGARGALAFTGLTVGAIALALIFFGARLVPICDSVTLTAPVTGRWLAVNSPATKVPSHGVRMYGQAYAVDLVYEPESGGDGTESIGIVRPPFGGRPAMREPSTFPAFGQPVRAMVSGEVVRASDWRRDHRSRSNILALLYLMCEGVIREIGGPGFIVGNHVTIRSDGGEFAVVGHLQRGSLAVRVGDRVRAGQLIARCGNSGNSTEPHVHAQLMDRASPWTGQGLPMAFEGVDMPATGEHMYAAVGVDPARKS